MTNPKILYKEDHKGWGRYVHNSDGSIVRFIFIHLDKIFRYEIVASGPIDIDEYIRMSDSEKDIFLLSINDDRILRKDLVDFKSLNKHYPEAATKLRNYRLENILDGN